MAPNIFNKSVYIIFIISINIVSMVCINYDPIEISYSGSRSGREKYYLYINYLDNTKTEDTKKLNFEQFYISVFNSTYKFSHYIINTKKLEDEITEFCFADDKFIPFYKFNEEEQRQTRSTGKKYNMARNYLIHKNVGRIRVIFFSSLDFLNITVVGYFKRVLEMK
ncbi:uncharacterized protein LOC114131530 isoform X2 [Aphis gossypii]|uniref:uncharacterized protein LOC114131530 isoform X2 n=1 Tax=Aphis gossypii TaxID=80765 RepID=UPI0021593253|nr:uncharacterized protein LOC114131530 isoform X2 [Aphis gossypii]